jgi:YidC/Oxa1 family membrane protein insertase
MLELYNIILYQPVFNALVFLYNVIPGHEIGFAIIALTILIKLILFPLNAQAIRSQKALSDIQPKMQALQTQYKDDKTKLAEETMKLYKEQKVNPLSSCLPVLIQLPFLIAVYQAFRSGLTSANLDHLYSFIANPGHINTMMFGLVDLALPSIVLAILAGGAQFIQTKMMSSAQVKVKSDAAKDEQLLATMNKSMIYTMPILTIFIGLKLPAGLTLYWFVSTLLTALQQYIFMGNKKNVVAGTVVNQK